MSDTPRTDAHIDGLRRDPEVSGCDRTLDFACQLERELNAANDKIKRMEEEVQELKVVNEYAWQKNGKLNDRIRRLIKLGLETAEYGLQNHREQWEQEEEL